jgi:hypothetical protein
MGTYGRYSKTYIQTVQSKRGNAGMDAGEVLPKLQRRNGT